MAPVPIAPSSPNPFQVRNLVHTVCLSPILCVCLSLHTDLLPGVFQHTIKGATWTHVTLSGSLFQRIKNKICLEEKNQPSPNNTCTVVGHRSCSEADFLPQASGCFDIPALTCRPQPQVPKSPEVRLFNFVTKPAFAFLPIC